MRDFVINNWIQVVTFIGVMVGWFFDRRNRRAAEKSNESTAADTVTEMLNKFAERFKVDYAYLEGKYNTLLAASDALEQKLSLATKENEELKDEIDKLRKTIGKQQQEINNLKRR